MEPSLLTSLVHFTTVAVAGQVLNPRKLVVSVKGCSSGVVLEFSSDARGSNGTDRIRRSFRSYGGRGHTVGLATARGKRQAFERHIALAQQRRLGA